MLEDENASRSDIEAARKQVEQDERALERINEDIEGEAEKLPLRERVKRIFKKYGWTLQAVVLAAGITISAVVLATLNGLKASTKAVGNGLKALAKKAAAALPGLIGSIVSFLFKTAGQALSFLAEHAWLLILAVVAFLVQRGPQTHEVVSRCRPLISAKQQSPPKQAHLQQRGPCSHDEHQPGPLRAGPRAPPRACLWLSVVGELKWTRLWLHVEPLRVLTPGLLLPVCG